MYVLAPNFSAVDDFKQDVSRISMPQLRVSSQPDTLPVLEKREKTGPKRRGRCAHLLDVCSQLENSHARFHCPFPEQK